MATIDSETRTGLAGGEGTVQLVQERDDVVVLAFEGEFDLVSAPDILEDAQRPLDDGKHVILDLSGATFIDSSIVNAVFRIQQAAAERGRVVVLQLGASPAIERVLEISGITRVVPRAGDRPGAVTRINELAAGTRGPDAR